MIGISSFVPEGANLVGCTDVTGFPSYFARVQGGWDWIHETVSGYKFRAKISKRIFSTIKKE